MPLPLLAGQYVCLEPLSADHLPELLSAGQDEQVWAYITLDGRNREAMQGYIGGLLSDYAKGTALPYAVRSLQSGEIVGCTRLKSLARAHRSALVGSWYSPEAWGTGVNTEAKLLLLSHAFEALGCIRVEFQTDSRNLRSRAALTRMGAQQEGVLRANQLVRGGQRRDSVVFSVLDHEWAAVRAGLEARLQR
jgi:N-acetyltransferase